MTNNTPLITRETLTSDGWVSTQSREEGDTYEMYTHPTLTSIWEESERQRGETYPDTPYLTIEDETGDITGEMRFIDTLTTPDNVESHLQRVREVVETGII